MSTYAVGDLQGCFEPLQRLLDLCRFDPARDRLWLVGDLVNRGPQSLEALRFARALGEAAVCLLGNHDLSLLMVAHGHGKVHRLDTYHHVLDAPDAAELLEWLRHRPLMHVEGTHAMVHAGLLPGWTVAQALALAHEVQAALRGPEFTTFLGCMWGSQPDAWSDDLHGWARLRVIVNAMTRLRFCTPDGRMEFRSKGGPEAPPDGFMPWFEVPQARWRDGHTLVCGHWSALGLKKEKTLLALDSGCLWGGGLTAARLEDHEIFQVRCPQVQSIDEWQ